MTHKYRNKKTDFVKSLTETGLMLHTSSAHPHCFDNKQL